MNPASNQVLIDCVLYHDFKWPKQLWTGVMFFKGFRITIQDFVDTASRYKAYVEGSST